MRGLAIVAGMLALAVPSVAAAAGTSHADAERAAVPVSPRVFAAVAVEACRDRQERPFGVVRGGEKAAYASNLACHRRLLERRRLLTRVVLACAVRLGQRARSDARALTGCSVSLLARPSGR